VSRERPTILQIIPKLDTGGAERTVVEISEAVTRAGGLALVAAEDGRLAPAVRAAGGEIIDLPMSTKNPARMLKNARTIASIVGKRGVDIIHARSRAPAWSGLIAARITKIPFVTTYHGAYSEKNAFKRWYNSVMARSDVVIANSHYTADLIRGRYRTPDQRMAVIPRGFDPKLFADGPDLPARVAALKIRWRTATGAPVVLHAARLTHWKGQTVVIDAFAELVRSGRAGDAVAILAGDDQGRTAYREDLAARIAAVGLEDRVRLVGHVEDIPAAFAAAHVAVVASIEPEAFGRAAAEAQAMACPTIVTAIGAPPEILATEPTAPPDAVTGWLVPPGDAIALADRIAVALALTPERRRTMGLAARARAFDLYSIRRMQAATLGVYDRLLQTDLEARFAAAEVVPAGAAP
jgi:glycosyltransferase involved in cell wall biosynthesis